MTEEKAKSVNFTSGLLVGTVAAAAIAFLYKTDSGKKVKKVIDTYYREAKTHFSQLVKEVTKQTKTVSLPEAVEIVAKKKIKIIKKNVFSKSGKPLVK